MHLDLSKLNQLLVQEPELTYILREHLFNRPLGTASSIWHEQSAVLLANWGVQFYGDEDVLNRLLNHLNPGKEYELFGIPARYLPLLEAHFRDIRISEDCRIYTLSGENFPRQQVQALGSLTVQEAEFVNDHWDYKDQWSKDLFLEIIARFPSSAVRANGHLAGWSVCYGTTSDYVNLGALKVLPEHRQRGYGRLLALDLAAKVLNSGKRPLVHILENNLASQNLSASIGFVCFPEKVVWGRAIKK